RHILNDFLSVDSGQPLSGWFSLKSILPKRGSAFYINGVISGFSHGRKPLQLLLFWSFAHGWKKCLGEGIGCPEKRNRRESRSLCACC
ncbi:hypothetical protein, partial [Dysosmobacter sp.]|uniref:hypothetical protein n=1 Tax=Dysosmobacter sp. TaxID=2591382 RepID=UPI002F95ECCC